MCKDELTEQYPLDSQEEADKQAEEYKEVLLLTVATAKNELVL